MAVVVMQCTSSEDHPDADRLKVYKFVSHIEADEIQIVANLTNVYEVGELAAVAEVGTVLSFYSDMDEESLEIKERKVRGVLSQGMALCKLELGTVLSNRWPI
jgi:tRNA-binding EMAP/Myf-like protein